MCKSLPLLYKSSFSVTLHAENRTSEEDGHRAPHANNAYVNPRIHSQIRGSKLWQWWTARVIASAYPKEANEWTRKTKSQATHSQHTHIVLCSSARCPGFLASLREIPADLLQPPAKQFAKDYHASKQAWNRTWSVVSYRQKGQNRCNNGKSFTTYGVYNTKLKYSFGSALVWNDAHIPFWSSNMPSRHSI